MNFKLITNSNLKITLLLSFYTLVSAAQADSCVDAKNLFEEQDSYAGCELTFRVKDQKTGHFFNVNQIFPTPLISSDVCAQFCAHYDNTLASLDSAETTQVVAGTSGDTNTVRLYGVENEKLGYGQAFGAFSQLILNYDFVKKIGQKNLDLGGGSYNHTSAMLSGFGVSNHVYDPYRRSQAHNSEVLKPGHYDSVTSFSVLNVIATSKDRLRHVELARDVLADNGYAYFKVYEGASFETEGTGTFQLRQPTRYYLELIGNVFGAKNVRMDESRHLLIAQKKR